ALWTDERLWKKYASRNAESSDNREDIKVFFSAIDEIDSLAFMQAFDTYFDKEKFYLFWGLDELLGAYHHDLFHNHKIYFDPYRGKFEPIEWDIRFWSIGQQIPVTPLFKQILLNPILKYENDLITYKLWREFTVDHVIDMIDDANNTIEDELAADPYRQHTDAYNKYFGLDKVIPFSMSEYTDAIKELKQTYKVRYKHVEKLLDYSSASYHIEEISEDQMQITIKINGNSPIDFDPWSIITESLRGDVELSRVYEDKTHPVLNHGQLDRLYPGIAIIKYSPVTIADGKDKFMASPLHYRYLIKGAHGSDVIKANELTGRNAITSNIVAIEKVDDLPDNGETRSLHPWQLLSQTKSIKNKIILSGEIEVYYDLVFTGEQKVTILPGTVFKLYNNTSIFFYGKIVAKGTAALPIKFERMNIDQPWGSLVIQGKKASGSHMSHIKVSGGSIASRNLIHYPGQFNIHDVDSFQLEDCTISNNSIGDDALHVAYSQGDIQRCEFKNTAFDALDMDIVDVTVSDSKFFNIGNDAIDLMNSKTVIDNFNIIGSGDKCISVGEASQVTIQNSQLKNCKLGIAVKDQSSAQVENIEFSLEPGNAIALYRKNPRYSKGGELQGDRLYGITEKDIVVGDYSINNIQKSAYLPLSNP
ncbi:MAG: right-handed parallel beta-helix repeat-containing protein, partial [Proteobacteria bacterium]|nr:right-handed parallel beta-helix repeat-containing protein [Pseudomonadota bacterium]